MVDLEAALRHLRSQDLARDLWVPDILRHEDDLRTPDRLYLAAASRLDLDEPLDAAINIPVPKSSFFLRNAINLTLTDRLAYHGAVAAIAPRIDARVHDNVYSSRVSADPKRLLNPGTAAWVRWKSAIEDCVVKSKGWMIETDITSYFDCISHAILMQDLQILPAPSPIVDAIREMLRTWGTSPSTGIPQGPDASRVLGNFYMIPIDDIMVSIPNIQYFRYMDDIRIVAAKKHDAVEALKTLDGECRRRNLYLSTKKTILLQNDSALRSLVDDKIEAARYIFEAGEDPVEVRRTLRALFKTALTGDEVNSRRAKFSIFRLRAIRDDGVLRLALKRLEELAPLGWLVPAYLLPWLRRKWVQAQIEAYLEDPERNTSDYLSTWLLAAFLDDPTSISLGVRKYARRVAFDKSCSSYHRAVALNVVALRGDGRDISALRDIVHREYDPEVVRAALVGLKRAASLDKHTAAKARRIAGLEGTLSYLKGRTTLPSLIMASHRNPLP